MQSLIGFITGRACLGFSLLIAVVVGLCSCQSDQGDYPRVESDAKVVLNIKTPAVSARSSTRASQVPGEVSVEDVHIMVFSDASGGGTYSYEYMVRGSLISTQEDGSTRFEARLNTTDIRIKLVILANATTIFTSYEPGYGQSEQVVREALELAFPADGMASNLPMYGEVVLPTGIDAGTTNIIEVTVLRAVARVDVVADLTAASPAFTISEVYIYRANDRLMLIPDQLASGTTLKVENPTVPADAAPLPQPIIKRSDTPTDSIGGIYIPESLQITGVEQRRLQATSIIVGGTFGDDTAVTYYRADFNPGVEGHPFGQVLRNHLYRFTVRRVTASGWETPEEAATNLAASMTVEVQQWEEFTTDMYFHEDYIGLSTKNVIVPFLPNYTQTIDVDASMNYSIEWVNAPQAGSVSEYDTPISDGYFTATIIHDPSEGDAISHIRIESPQYNKTDQIVSATLRLTAGDTSVDISVTKESPSLYSNRAFQVMSMGTSYGSLGDYVTTVTTTRAMRQVLDTNFSPTSQYPFKIGGFFFLTVPISTTIYAGATTAADVAYFKKMIDNTDVLILAYTNTTSIQVANMLLNEWLVEKPHRVLWVMTDATNYNVGMLTRYQQRGLGTWVNGSGIFSSTYGYRASEDADYGYTNARDVEQFYSGPFGDVVKGSALFYSDVISGLVLLPDSAKRVITPLVYNNNPPYRNYMSVGVETDLGIVYMGESQLFQGNVGMSTAADTNGTINGTPVVDDDTSRYYLDVLNANIWAWVVGRVIYGPPPPN